MPVLRADIAHEGSREDDESAPQGALEPVEMCTVADYAVDFGWFAHCLMCFRDRGFTTEDIARLFGLDSDVGAVRARLRCARCGARRSLLYRYYRDGMHGPGDGAYRAP